MAYDENISLEVSLHKILDVFITECEKSSVIVDFLMLHDDVAIDILKNSIYSVRLFQLDFILQCSNEHAEYILNLAKRYDSAIAGILCWQIYRSKSKNANKIKYKNRTLLESCIKKCTMRHPYSTSTGKLIQDFDNLLFDAAISDCIPETLRDLSESSFIEAMRYCNRSLFLERIFQYDVFEQLDVTRQYLMVKTIVNSKFYNGVYVRYGNNSSIANFILQIFDSECDIGIKKACYDMASSTMKSILYENGYENVRKLYSDCSSAQEFILKKSICGSDEYEKAAVYLLFFKPKWLKEWAEYDKEDVDKFIKVSDFISELHFYAKHETQRF